jgi:hypothetical protein
MNWDWILYGVVSVFVAWEGIAHYVLHNRDGHTLSNRITWLEGRGGWPVRVLVAAVVVALGVHLEGLF